MCNSIDKDIHSTNKERKVSKTTCFNCKHYGWYYVSNGDDADKEYGCKLYGDSYRVQLVDEDKEAFTCEDYVNEDKERRT